jgi:hypothetical protein
LYWTCLKSVLHEAKKLYVSFDLCPRCGQGENSKMFVGSTFEIIPNDLQNTMNNTITSSSTCYYVDHIKSQGTLMGSSMSQCFELEKEDYTQVLLVTKLYTWSLNVMFAPICILCNFNYSNVIL